MPHQSIQKRFNKLELESIINHFQLRYGNIEYIDSKHQLILPQKDPISIRLPLNFSYQNGDLFDTNFLIMLIHAGEAALAYSEEDQIVEHKMAKAYMVRQKQGKSQIKHLKTKGKSKAGSRVRLASTEYFFEDINKKIAEWEEYFEISKIAISCNKTLAPFLFNRTDAAIDKNDERLFKIPKHIQEANFENIISVHNYLISTELNFNKEEEAEIEYFISNLEDE